jgi:hypothetical protein
MWKPRTPMLLDIAVNHLLFEAPLQISKQVDRDEFLICKERLGRIRTPALILERWMFIVGCATPQKELNELDY